MSRILVVEDDQAQRLLYKMAITDLGHQVSVASNGIEALKKIDAELPDLIIMDIMMPGMGGLEALRIKLHTHPEIPVILHSALSSCGNDERSWSAEEYVQKSSDLTHLKSAIKRALSNWPYSDETTGNKGVTL